MPIGNWLSAVAIAFVSIFLGLVAMVFSGSIFNFFFVIIIVLVLWDSNTKINELQKKVSEIEGKLSKEHQHDNTQST